MRVAICPPCGNTSSARPEEKVEGLGGVHFFHTTTTTATTTTTYYKNDGDGSNDGDGNSDDVMMMMDKMMMKKIGRVQRGRQGATGPVLGGI